MEAFKLLEEKGFTKQIKEKHEYEDVFRLEKEKETVYFMFHIKDELIVNFALNHETKELKAPDNFDYELTIVKSFYNELKQKNEKEK